jgi:RHS repeat-associated protein
VDGSVASVSYPAAGGLPAETVTATYDTTGRPLTSIGLDTYVAATTYYAFGAVNERILGSGTKRVRITTAVEEATTRLTQSTVDTENQSTPDSWTNQFTEAYSHDAAGNVKGVNEVSAANQCFSYDGLRQLTEAWTTTATTCQATPTQAVVGGADPYWTSYRYGPTGDRTTETRHRASGDTVRTYTYPAAGAGQPHTLRSVAITGAATGTDTYTYDAAGNTLTRAIAGKPGQTLTWDAEGHLATIADSGGTTRYVYTADGQRLLAKEPMGTTLYLGTQEVRAVGSTVTATRYYGKTAVRTAAGGLTWQTNDHHGTGQVSIAAATLAVTRRRLDPYGNPRASAPVAWPTSRGFVNGTIDPTGLTHLGAREYEPEAGRFISDDPITNTGTPLQMNGYNYGNNNPVALSDPAGTEPGSWCLDSICGQANTMTQTSHPMEVGFIGNAARKRSARPLACTGGEHSGGCGRNDFSFSCSAQAPEGQRCSHSPNQQSAIGDLRGQVEEIIKNAGPMAAICYVGVAGWCPDGVDKATSAWCWHYGALDCLAGYLALDVAREFVEQLIAEGRLNARDEGKINAFRHMFGMAYLIHINGMSPTQALQLGVAHEMDGTFGGQRWGDDESLMDLHHNFLGATVAVGLPRVASHKLLVDSVLAVVMAATPNCTSCPFTQTLPG